MNTKEKEAFIAQLSGEYQSLIVKDHHKDRDCHFYIEVIWSYGEGPRFVPAHHGYIYDNENFTEDMPEEVSYGGAYKEGFAKYEDALDWVIKKLKLMISLESQRQIEDEY